MVQPASSGRSQCSHPRLSLVPSGARATVSCRWHATDDGLEDARGRRLAPEAIQSNDSRPSPSARGRRRRSTRHARARRRAIVVLKLAIHVRLYAVIVACRVFVCATKNVYASACTSDEKNPDDNSAGEFRMKKNAQFYELGFGIDFYLDRFKFTPSIRGVFALNDELIRDKDPNSPWTSNINKMQTRGVFINFTVQ